MRWVAARGEAEVGELERLLAAGDEDVGWLEVAVHDCGVQPMQVLQRAQDVQGPAESLLRSQSEKYTIKIING